MTWRDSDVSGMTHGQQPDNIAFTMVRSKETRVDRGDIIVAVLHTCTYKTATLAKQKFKTRADHPKY